MIDKSFPLLSKMKLDCRFSSGSLTVRARDDLAEARVVVTAQHGNERVLDQFRVEARTGAGDVTIRRANTPEPAH